VRLAYAETLHASGDLDGARVAITSARDRLLERAARIRDDGQRKRFLDAIPENARTLECAQAWVE
jgi:eukaryotic-like serine/threonine-protein kinase